MSKKVDTILVEIQKISVGVARLEQKFEDLKPRCENHAARLEKGEKVLFGDNGYVGICEEVRNLKGYVKKANTVITTGIIFIWELVRHKITGKW